MGVYFRNDGASFLSHRRINSKAYIDRALYYFTPEWSFVGHGIPAIDV
jgi:hypothetical protein